jgi:hypothetical protein
LHKKSLNNPFLPLSASGEGDGGRGCSRETPPLTPPRLRGGEYVRAFAPVEWTYYALDFCNFFPPPLSDSSSLAKLQTSPGNELSLSRLCPPHLRTSSPYRYRTLKIVALSSSLHASYAISVRRASVLPAASFRFQLAMDTLAVRLTIPPVGFVGDFHSLVRAPCRAHNKKRAETNPP